MWSTGVQQGSSIADVFPLPPPCVSRYEPNDGVIPTPTQLHKHVKAQHAGEVIRLRASANAHNRALHVDEVAQQLGMVASALLPRG